MILKPNNGVTIVRYYNSTCSTTTVSYHGIDSSSSIIVVCLFFSPARLRFTRIARGWRGSQPLHERATASKTRGYVEHTARAGASTTPRDIGATNVSALCGHTMRPIVLRKKVKRAKKNQGIFRGCLFILFALVPPSLHHTSGGRLLFFFFTACFFRSFYLPPRRHELLMLY